MGGLFGGGTVTKISQTPAAALQLQSSSYGWPLTILYGRNRVTGNLIGYYDFKATAHTKKTSSGGKGGGSKTKTTTYTYSATFIMALSEGESSTLNACWADKSYDGTASKFTFFTGSSAQTAWSYMLSSHSSDALNYRGLSYCASANYDLGSSQSMPQFSFDMTGLLPYTGTTTDTSTQMLLHMQDALGATSPSDDSSRTWTVTADALTVSTRSRFGSTSWALSTVGGTAGSMQTSSVSGLNAGSGAFGISLEFWPTAYHAYGVVFCANRYSWNTGAILFGYDATGSTVGLYAYPSGTAICVMPTTEIPTGQWNHIEINRDSSGNVWLTVGGAIKSYTTGSTVSLDFGNTGQFMIGNSDINGQPAAGYYSEFAIRIGNCFHAGSFTPPSSVYEYRPSSSTAGGVTPSGANPPDIISDLITNTEHGVGLPSSYIASLTQYSDYCVANNIFLSPVYDKQSEARQMLADIFRLTNSGCFFSEKKLKVTPFGDTSATANGVTFTPAISASYSLTDDDFLDGQSPVKVNRKRASDFYNCVDVEYLDKTNQFNKSIGTASDQSNIYAFGLRKMDTVVAHCVTDGATANKVAQLLMLRALYVRAQYEFTIGFKYCLLEPCDYVTITDSGLGLDALLVRILSIEETEDGQLNITAEDAQFGTGNAASYSYASGAGYAANTDSSTAGNVIAPLIFEDPNQSTASALRIGIAVTGNNSNWGGCEVWASNDGSNYQYAGNVVGGARYGTTTSGISGAVGQVPRVSLLGIGGEFTSGSASDADANSTLCLIGSEYVAYTTASLVSSNVYDLTLHNRGVYSTSAASHSSGVTFVRIDAAIVYTDQMDLSNVGKTLYFKFLSYNLFGGGIQSIADVTAYTYTITGAMVPAAQAVVASAVGIGSKQDFYPTVQTISSASGVVTIDLSASTQDYIITLTENVTSFVFNNLPAANTVREITLETIQAAGASYTCVNPGTKTAGSWTQSATNNAAQVLRLRIFHDGTVHNFPDPVLA